MTDFKLIFSEGAQDAVPFQSITLQIIKTKRKNHIHNRVHSCTGTCVYVKGGGGLSKSIVFDRLGGGTA